jgi:hypothetical protein
MYITQFMYTYYMQWLQNYAAKYVATTSCQKAWRVGMRYLAIARNAIVVVASTLVIANITQPGQKPPVYVTGRYTNTVSTHSL